MISGNVRAKALPRSSTDLRSNSIRPTETTIQSRREELHIASAFGVDANEIAATRRSGSVAYSDRACWTTHVMTSIVLLTSSDSSGRASSSVLRYFTSCARKSVSSWASAKLLAKSWRGGSIERGQLASKYGSLARIVDRKWRGRRIHAAGRPWRSARAVWFPRLPVSQAWAPAGRCWPRPAVRIASAGGCGPSSATGAEGRAEMAMPCRSGDRAGHG